MRRNIEQYRNLFEHLIHAVKNELAAKVDKVDVEVTEQGSLVRTISDQLGMQASLIHTLSASVEELQDQMAALRSSPRAKELGWPGLAEITDAQAAFLNHVSAWNGPAAEAGLFVNHPYLVEWKKGTAFVRLVNERILEQPFVFSAVADLPLGSRVLDIGGGESIVALALASIGYQTTVIEPRGYPFSHPNLTVYDGPLEDFSDEPFQAVISLSTIEHLGIGHYADGTPINPSADKSAVKQISQLIAPGGRFVLTAPYGPAQVTELQRIYDRTTLLDLLEGWKIVHLAIGRQIDETTWSIESTELVDPTGDNQVVMLVAQTDS